MEMGKMKKSVKNKHVLTSFALIFQISVSNATERAKQSEEEAKEEADRLAAAATTSLASTEQS